MQKRKLIASAGIAAGLALAGAANAAVITVNADITTSTTWTANNTYRLAQQIFVKNGATLTIEPGTLIASSPSGNGSGSLCITRGSKIIANGTCDHPIIFTSTNDNMTSWREAALEWGNVTIEGRAYISNTKTNPNNSSTCSGSNISKMEGLIEDPVGNPDVFYGGDQDDDDSGTLRYVSIRYGGRVIGVGDELNGLSMGGIGRETDVEYVEIMNNVDDGVETWGGTVNYKHLALWNVGDDSFDVDQGWRGKAQFVLVVQGYSLDASQGSGVGDQCCEIDGAEKADAQPVTRCCLYNFTLIGQPIDGDQGIEYRDGAGVQARNFIFMDIGDKVIRNGVSDGEGSLGYGYNGTPSFASLFTTPYTTLPSVNACSNPGARYQSQSAGSAAIGQGFVNEVTDSVFFRNLNNAYSSAAPNEGADQVGITNAGGSNSAKGNVVIPGFADADAPIQQLVREIADVDMDGNPGRTAGGKIMLRVLQIDPRPKNAATTSNAMAPNDGFFTPANYRGAFPPNENWLCGWTAASQYGFLITPAGVCPQCPAGQPCPADLTGAGGMPDGTVDVNDLFVLLANFGTNGLGSDLAAPTNTVDVNDLFVLLAAFGPCP